MDVYQFAMDFEMAGREYYLKLASESHGAAGKRIFTLLAEDEQQHYEYLKRMAQNNKITVESGNVSAAEAVFAEMLGTEELLGHMLPIDLYSHGITLEDKSIAFYREKSITETDPAARILFLKLYFEEKKHKLLLENILEMILEPERQLASPELERPLKP